MSDGIIEAVVQVGTDQTRYLRCGRGERAVIVLAENSDERLRLLGMYAAACRVIAPVPEAGEPAAWESWLNGVIEGLGLEHPDVVLSTELSWLAERITAGCGAMLRSVQTAQNNLDSARL